MTVQRAASSFRDPSGFIFERDGVLLRQVNHIYRAHYEQLMSSGLYDGLVRDHLMVSHQEVDDPGLQHTDGFRVLAPERVPFVSYPYEWCFSQLKEAALATLDIQARAVEHGMSLRDASAYNIQWVGGRPVLIDTLSFERLEEGAPWIAYRQFCQHFLAPLALMSNVDVRLAQLLRVHLDGIPLDLTAQLLPTRVRLRPSMQIHINAHAKSQQRHAAAQTKREDVKGRFSLRALQGLIDSLRGAVSGLEWEPGSHWLDYYEGDSYSDEGITAKERVVRGYLDELQPKVVWDLGSNTGRFSRIAAEVADVVVSFEADPAAVEANHRQIASSGSTAVLPLVMDLTNPSPGLGWANRERAALGERGPADVLLALALVHHLAIGNNVPLDRLAEDLSGLGDALVIEFVPKEDPKVQVLLGSREDIFGTYHEAGFEQAFERWFHIERRDRLTDSARTVYLMRRR